MGDESCVTSHMADSEWATHQPTMHSHSKIRDSSHLQSCFHAARCLYLLFCELHLQCVNLKVRLLALKAKRLSILLLFEAVFSALLSLLLQRAWSVGSLLNCWPSKPYCGGYEGHTKVCNEEAESKQTAQAMKSYLPLKAQQDCSKADVRSLCMFMCSLQDCLTYSGSGLDSVVVSKINCPRLAFMRTS